MMQTAAFLLPVGLVAIFIWPFVLGRYQMQEFCSSIAAGSLLSQVEEAAERKGYRLSLGNDGVGFIHDSRSFGRFICRIDVSQGLVVAKKYLLND
jgi:hypothetical protein